MKILISTLFFCFFGNALCVDDTKVKMNERQAATMLLFKAIEEKLDVRPFIELGADLKDTNIKGIPPLAYAIRQDNDQAIETLLPKSVLHISFQGSNYLHEALKKKKISLFDRIFDTCKEEKALWGIIDAADSHQNTPFHLAAYFLLESIKDVPLMSDILVSLKKLKAANASMEKENCEGRSVISILKEAQDEITKHRQLYLGWTELHIAMKGRDMTLEREDFDAMRTAYQKFPLSINAPNQKGTTPFLIVAYKFHKFTKQGDVQNAKKALELLKVMKEGGGQLDLANKEGISVQMLLDELKTKI